MTWSAKLLAKSKRSWNVYPSPLEFNLTWLSIKFSCLAFYGYVPFCKGNLVIFQKTWAKYSPMFSNMKHYVKEYILHLIKEFVESLIHHNVAVSLWHLNSFCVVWWFSSKCFQYFGSCGIGSILCNKSVGPISTSISTVPQKDLMSHITILSSTVKCHHSSYPHFYSKKLLVFRQNGKMSLPKLHGKGVNLWKMSRLLQFRNKFKTWITFVT